MEKQDPPFVLSIPETAYKVEVLAQKLKAPWSVASMPSGGYLVTERSGSLKRINGTNVQTIKGLPEDILNEGQGGLFEVLLSPNFTADQTIYLSYAKGTIDSNGTAVIKGRLVNGSLVDKEELFSANPKKHAASHFGGRLTFLNDESLALSMGEGFEFREASQDDKFDLGKIIRISESGNSHISKGHRNVQGLAYDNISQTLWSHEHGPRGGDEVNRIQQGANYGWPMTSHGLDYNGAKITPLTTMDGVTDPLHVWTPSIAPSGLTVYQGDMFPEWKGDLFIGGLASGDIRRLDIEDNKVVEETRFLSEMQKRVRDIKEAPDGALLVILEDPEEGQLIRVSKP